MTQSCTEEFVLKNFDYEEDTAILELLAEKQDYLDYIDADMEAFYSIKTEAISPEA